MNFRAFTDALVVALTEHLRTGKAPRLPTGGELIWRWFLDLHAGRGLGMAGPLPISWADIEAYRRLTGCPIERRHIDVLMALDRIYVDHSYSKQQQGGASAPRSSGKDLSLGVFDAMFA